MVWMIRRSNPVQYDSELTRAVERVVGKDNIFYCGDKQMKTHDKSGEPYYPQNYHRGNVRDVIAEIKPDVVFIDGIYGFDRWGEEEPRNDFRGIDIPRATFMADVHGEWGCRLRLAKTGQINMIFVRNYLGGIGYRVKNEMNVPVGFCPWAVSTSMFYDLNVPRGIDFYLSGIQGYAYPLRKLMSKDIYLKYGAFPEKGIINDLSFILDAKRFTRHKYLSALNESKLMAFDTGIFKYSVMKFYEAMACNTLVLSNLPHDWKVLGFKPNENMVMIDYDNWWSKIKYWVEHENERKKVARNGYDLIQRCHTTDIRAKQLIAQLEELINSYNEERPYDYQNVKGNIGEVLRALEWDAPNFNRNNFFHRVISEGIQLMHHSWYPTAQKIWKDVLLGRKSVEEWVRYCGPLNP